MEGDYHANALLFTAHLGPTCKFPAYVLRIGHEYICLLLPGPFRIIRSIKKSWILHFMRSNRTLINPIQVPKRFTSNMTPYTDQKGPPEDELVDHRLLTEKNIEDRGLTNGAHSKISTLRGMLLRHRLCILSLIAILCLFLSYNSVHPASILHANRKNAEAEWTGPSVLTKQLEISNPWNVTGYSDENYSNSIFSDSDRGPTDCRSSSTSISQIDFANGIYTLFVYRDANCTEEARTFSGKEFLCADAQNASSWQIGF